ncbi:MAG: Flp pilus assembly protein CpaB [Planctomycetia bacterium]|nr:Flp pilus assembly protein CpaB [Planctomycetia bacterium]
MPLRKPHISPFTALIVGAIILGIGVAWLVMHTLQSREAAAAAALRARMEKNRVEVVVPTRNLKPGSVADSADMAARNVPHDVIYPQTLTAATWGNYSGRVLTRPVYKGRPLLSTDFGPVAKRSFAGELAPGERALTIDVSGINSIANLIVPGNRIDLMLLAKGPQGTEELPLLRHIRVLATGHSTTPVAYATIHGAPAHITRYGSITLAVTPQQTAKLALAAQVGQIRVALIPQHHPASGPLPTLLKDDLFGTSAGTQGVASPPMVQYIIGSPGRNKVSELPESMPMQTSASTAGPQSRVMAREQQDLSTLTHLVRAATPTAGVPSDHSTAELPKGYP